MADDPDLVERAQRGYALTTEERQRLAIALHRARDGKSTTITVERLAEESD